MDGRERDTAAAFAREVHRFMKETKNELLAAGYGRDAVYFLLLSAVARVVFEDEGEHGVGRVTRMADEMGRWRG